MSKPKIDGVIEAVHYNKEGFVEWVRAYLRRGPTFSDRILLDRVSLIENLKSGKHYFAGYRIPLMASTFETRKPVQLIKKDDREILVTGDLEVDKDFLEGIPII